MASSIVNAVCCYQWFDYPRFRWMMLNVSIFRYKYCGMVQNPTCIKSLRSKSYFISLSRPSRIDIHSRLVLSPSLILNNINGKNCQGFNTIGIISLESSTSPDEIIWKQCKRISKAKLGTTSPWPSVASAVKMYSIVFQRITNIYKIYCPYWNQSIVRHH